MTLIKTIISIFSFYNFGTESACKTDSQAEGDPWGEGEALVTVSVLNFEIASCTMWLQPNN